VPNHLEKTKSLVLQKKKREYKTKKKKGRFDPKEGQFLDMKKGGTPFEDKGHQKSKRKVYTARARMGGKRPKKKKTSKGDTQTEKRRR